MPGKYSLEAESVDDPYRNFLRHIPAKDSINWKLDSCHVGHLLDSVAQLAIPRVRKVEDLQTVTADFLIDNIDRAFHAWETSKYTRHYTFDDFLHHVLPYRIGHEPLTPWLTPFKRKGGLTDAKLRIRIERSNTFAFLLKG